MSLSTTYCPGLWVFKKRSILEVCQVLNTPLMLVAVFARVYWNARCISLGCFLSIPTGIKCSCSNQYLCFRLVWGTTQRYFISIAKLCRFFSRWFFSYILVVLHVFDRKFACLLSHVIWLSLFLILEATNILTVLKLNCSILI